MFYPKTGSFEGVASYQACSGLIDSNMSSVGLGKIVLMALMDGSGGIFLALVFAVRKYQLQSVCFRWVAGQGLRR